MNSKVSGLALIVVGRILMTATGLTWAALVMIQGIHAQEAGRTLTLFPGVLPTVVLAAVGYGSLACIRHGRRLRVTPASLLLARDFRPPVLYLRSFSADGSEIPTIVAGSSMFAMYGLTLESPTAEDDLAKVFEGIGPFIAIGNPGEALPELGASRLYVSHEDWQRVVTDLTQKARLVILRAGTSEGLLWEIENIFKNCAPEKVLIYLPYRRDPIHAGKGGNRKPGPYHEFRRLAGTKLPHPLPEDLGRSRFIVFRDNWVPECVAPLGIFRMAGGQGMTGSQAANLRRELSPVFQRLGCNAPRTRWPLAASLLRILVGLMVAIGLVVAMILLAAIRGRRSLTSNQ